MFVLCKSIDFREILCNKIYFGLLEKIANFHQEDTIIFTALNETCSNLLKSCELENVLKFSRYLAVSKSEKIYKEPEISEVAITEEDIAEALKRIGVKDPENVLIKCKKIVDRNKSGIKENYLQNKEETILITSYTHEDKVNMTSPYSIINKLLWENSIQDQFENKKSYLRLLLRALRKLPRTKPQTLYRGIKWDKHEYKVGEEIEWKGFSSTSTNMRATQAFFTNDKTKKVEGTLFEIRNAWGYDIHDFSDYTDEEGKFI